MSVPLHMYSTGAVNGQIPFNVMLAVSVIVLLRLFAAETVHVHV